MKLKRKKGYEGSIRTVYTDNGEKPIGIIGKSEDLIEAGIICPVTGTELPEWILFNLDGKALAEKPTREECFELVGWK